MLFPLRVSWGEPQDGAGKVRQESLSFQRELKGERKKVDLPQAKAVLAMRQAPVAIALPETGFLYC